MKGEQREVTPETLNCVAGTRPAAIEIVSLTRYIVRGEVKGAFAMKVKMFIHVFVLLGFSTASSCWGTVATFDELSETGSGAFFSVQYQGYMGLTWSNILCNNAILATNSHIRGLSGEFYGMVSPSNVVNLFTGSEIDSRGTNFNFLGAYLTGYANSNLNIEVQGFGGPTLLYDTTVVVSATSPTLFAFNYLDIDRLDFTSFGGQPAFGFGDSGVSIMDNFNFEFVPEPSAFLLTAAGALLLWSVAKRKRG